MLTSNSDNVLRMFVDVCLEIHRYRTELSGYLSLSHHTLALRYDHCHCMHQIIVKCRLVPYAINSHFITHETSSQSPGPSLEPSH